MHVVFALTRKRLGQIYRSRKRVSAIALLDLEGVEELHGRVVDLKRRACEAWEAECSRLGGRPPVQVVQDDVDVPEALADSGGGEDELAADADADADA